jgi:hypothetical protein
LLLLLVCGMGSAELCAQIRLANASFEGQPQDAATPVGWMPCDVTSTPDILPGFWGVHHRPKDGNTYIGLITRDDGSRENIGQRLSVPMKKGECYVFSLSLARSNTYAGYKMPLMLRVWGGTNACGRDQLLCESALIKHTDWRRYTFSFLAKNPYDYIMLEATYAKGALFYYKGNVLLDDLSSINVCQRAMVGTGGAKRRQP